MRDLHAENQSTLLKKFENDSNGWNDILCSQMRRINIIKMATLHKTVCRFNATSMKIPMMLFSELKEIILHSLI